MYMTRLAVPDDAKYLPAVELSAGQTFANHEKYRWVAEGEGQTEQEHLAFIHQQLEWVAVNNDGEVVGFINAEKRRNSLHICELSVCQNWQGQGIGRQLIKRVFEATLSLQLQFVTLTTFRDVPWNAPYYQRLGFDIIDNDKLTIELKAILQSEVDMGFAREDRCAMVISLNELAAS
ncbi:GNAT family N-acetyltransferase [Providencia rettgeri]|nr:GNAT family N-acetyltransferase [Providencia rettgeri]NIL70987.1 GNAT family N-acetyltransferase [Providencia sp. 504mA]HCI96050.1 N-acetyltransferase [Providencia sp.]EIU9515545.1 GNAT family N-acetyltransferase [Providencia rettgeri]EJD6082821.1 GNAT family N-acetyltransferase [Providencia rettgeri]